MWWYQRGETPWILSLVHFYFLFSLYIHFWNNSSYSLGFHLPLICYESGSNFYTWISTANMIYTLTYPKRMLISTCLKLNLALAGVAGLAAASSRKPKSYGFDPQPWHMSGLQVCCTWDTCKRATTWCLSLILTFLPFSALSLPLL